MLSKKCNYGMSYAAMNLTMYYQLLLLAAHQWPATAAFASINALFITECNIHSHICLRIRKEGVHGLKIKEKCQIRSYQAQIRKSAN